MVTFIDDLLTGGAASQADKSTKKAVDAFNIPLPDMQEMMIQLEDMVQQGILSPEEAQVYMQQASEMKNISLDPKLRKAQEDALAALQDISENKGLTAADRAQLAQIETQENTAARGQREAILQNAAERGISGSGLELMSQMQNQQEAATRKSQRDLDVAGMAQQRALQALIQSGQMGGQMEQADFERQAQVAAAQDAINRFNTQNQQQVNMANVQARNDAAARNLAEQQRIADQNVQTRNTQQQYNKSLAQKQFENQASLAAGRSSAYQNQAAMQTQRGAGTQGLIGSGLMAAAILSDENEKTDIENFDASQFLDDLTPSKYHYKNPKHGEGDQVGVMAQDIEKHVPQMVEETSEGKMVNFNKSGGPLFASLANLHKRLKKVEEGE